MPSLGADMETATLTEWWVKPGETVKKGQVIAVVETSKGAIEVEVFETGTVEQLLVSEGAEVSVGAPLAHIRSAGQPVRAVEAPVQPEAAAAPVLTVPAPAPGIAPVASAAVEGQGGPSGTRPRASPAARSAAERQAIDLVGIVGSGPGGAVLLADLPAAGRTAAATPAPLQERPPSEHKTHGRFEVAEMRKAIAAAMARSNREIPHYYLATTIDMLAARSWLDQYNGARAPEERLLMSVLLIKAVALSLRTSPEFNGFFRNGGFEPSSLIHPGIAINMRGGGLITPAIHDVDQLTLPELMAKLQDLTMRVRHGGLRSSEMMDATVTISALGESGVESVFGVIYPPQVAIVGFGKVVQRPWAIDGALAVHPVVTATLAADHRVSDGHRGGQFLAHIGQLLQRPETL